jgi:hypothetical protein
LYFPLFSSQRTSGAFFKFEKREKEKETACKSRQAKPPREKELCKIFLIR